MTSLFITISITDLSERSDIELENIPTYLKYLKEDKLIIGYKINNSLVTIEIDSTLELLFNGNLNEIESE